MYLPSTTALSALLFAAASTTASPLINRRSACSDLSFDNFEWSVSDFDFHANYIFSTPAHQNSWGYASFDLVNPADQSKVHCSAASNQINDFFYGTVSYACDDAAGGRLGTTKFDFNRPTGALKANQSWVCGPEEQYPVTFTGYGAVNLTLSCEETFYQNPNWTIGEIYSRRDITCDNVTTPMKLYEITAVA